MAEKKIKEQEDILNNNKKNMLVSASAGSGKTFIMIKYITQLVCEKHIPISEMVVLTFTKAAAAEMKERLQKSLKKHLKENPNDDYIIEQIDSLSTANISTIDSFCEKCLKKYANLIGLNDNFEIADESLSQKIKQVSFVKAFKKFCESFQEDYLVLVDFFKNDKKQIKNIVFEIENLANAVGNREEFLNENIQNSEKFFDKAIQFLFVETQKTIREIINNIEGIHIQDYEDRMKSVLLPILEANDIYGIARIAENVVLPKKPNVKVIGDEVSKQIDTQKKIIQDTLKQILSLNLFDEENIFFQRSGKLEKIILKLYFEFEKEQTLQKQSQNVLGFEDLEKYMAQLSEKENLFDGLKYVFVDEYQDTNKIQEKIVKNVAKNCNFVAVGDAKQGIYGFRLASCEIFLRDIENFDKWENSSVNYLKSNFRSDEKILNFVNDVFKVCMTEKSCGIDYLSSSMLKSENKFENDGTKAIVIDVVDTEKDESEPLEKVYDIKKAKNSVANKELKQLLDIKRQIFEVRKTKIFDDGEFRPCRYNDIAILSRSRSNLFNNLEAYLQESGIPVVASSRGKLLDEIEIKVLLNFLKIALNIDDEVALLSVLLSPFGKFSLEEIVDIKGKENLCELVKKEPIFEKFLKTVSDFNKNSLIFGIKKSFEILFDETNYRAYINMKPMYEKINYAVGKFLDEIVSSGYNFDLSGVINHFETVEIVLNSESTVAQDAVSLLTVHASKGLEYPVVFLIGCDKSFKDKPPKTANVKIDENFGLALKYYDIENNQEFSGAKMCAITNLDKKKDFAEELMIFYVALTRAKNKLYLFGGYDDKIFAKNSVFECSSYFDLVFYALKKQKEDFLRNGCYYDDSLEINHIEELVEQSPEKVQFAENAQFRKEDLEKIVDYLNFQYQFDDKLNFKLKESVTELSHKDKENRYEKYANENFSFSGAGVEIGNAYHLVLKVLDFDKICSFDDVISQINEKEILLKDVRDKIDFKLIFKNIMLLKPLIDGGKLFKEKEFILKEKLSKLVKTDTEEEILLQGIVDMFVVKSEEIVLVDYKYSNSNSDSYLIETYKQQLKFYKLALENAFNLPVKNTYLLSLKNAKLLKIDL